MAFKFSTAVNEIRFVFVLFTPNAVIALKRTLIDVSGIKKLRQKLLDCHFVALFGGANEVLIINVNGLKQRQPRVLDEPVGPGFGVGVVSKRGPKHLFAVLISTRQKERRIAALTMPAGNYIRCNLGVGMPNVWRIIHVEDRGCHIERLGHRDILGFQPQRVLVDYAL